MTVLGDTGLGSLAPGPVRTWLDRVRSGDLTDAEARATTVVVFRLWLVAFLLKALGSGWDVSWHFRWFRDDFAPPHDINLVGDGIAIVLVLYHWYTRMAVDKIALRLMVWGLSIFLLSAPADVINHRLRGLDITSWSVTHFGLYTGTAIMIAGVIRAWRLHGMFYRRCRLVWGGLWFFFLENVLFPNQQQEYGVLSLRNFLAGHSTADQEVMDFAANQVGAKHLDAVSYKHFALPIPDWVYPVWTVGAVVLVLVAARLATGRRWTATVIAGAYVAWRCAIWVALGAFGFPHSTVPFLLVLGGLAVDLVCLAGLPWAAEASLGALVATAAIYVGAWAQSVLVAAPPISYWSAPVAAVALLAGWAVVAGLRARRQVTIF